MPMFNVLINYFMLVMKFKRVLLMTMSLPLLLIGGCETDLTDVENRLDSLESRVDELETKCSENATAIAALKQAAENSVAISSYVETEDGYALTMSDGKVLDIVSASALTPNIVLGSTLGADYEADSYYISVDGKGWVKLASADQLVTGMEVDEEENLFIITLLNGDTLSIPYAKDMMFSFDDVDEVVYFDRGEQKQINVTMSNIASTVIVAPDGWKASLKSDVLTVTAPVLDNLFAEEVGEIQVIAVSKTGFSIVSKLPVSANVTAEFTIADLVYDAVSVMTTITVSDATEQLAYAVVSADSEVLAEDLFDGTIEGAVVEDIKEGEYDIEAEVTGLTELTDYKFVAAAKSITGKLTEVTAVPFTTEESGPILLGIENTSVNGCTLVFDRPVASRGEGQIYVIYVDLYTPYYIYTPAEDKEWVEGADFNQTNSFDGTKVNVTFNEPWAGNTMISYSIEEGAFVGANGKPSVECLSEPKVNGLDDWGFYYGYGWKNDVEPIDDIKFATTFEGTSFDTWRAFVAVAYRDAGPIDEYVYGPGNGIKFIYDENGAQSEVAATSYQVVDGKLRVKLPRRPAQNATVKLVLEEEAVTAEYGNYNARVESQAWTYTGDASDPDEEITGVIEGVYTFTASYDDLFNDNDKKFPFDLHVKKNEDGSYTVSNWFNLDTEGGVYSDEPIQVTEGTSLPAYYDPDRNTLIVGRSSKESTTYKIPYTIGKWSSYYVRLLTVNSYGNLVSSKGSIEFNIENGKLLYTSSKFLLGALTSESSITGSTYKGALSGYTVGTGGSLVYKGELPEGSAAKSSARRITAPLLLPDMQIETK